ncbi:hypothetical protein VM1G_03884 [Cytospora mali]|uniref:R3H-associated N-terminal domain-containing protein n=1 Tax=Cytospora mali TaxID=578113 RepID=A0A194VY93_CYTMA|nr:hypothetical protein VM1G_03884 [Valsa mali]
MAIYSAVPPPEDFPQPEPQPQPSQATAQPQDIPQHFRSASGTIDIEAWTISALESLSVSSLTARGPGAHNHHPLSIPLDDDHHARPGANVPRAGQSAARVTITVDGADPGTTITVPRRPPSRRDSMRRREALLKGKEGSRQRRRFDMKRLVDVPNVEPPQPEDWEPRPVYPVHHIPYHVAAYWDRGLRQQVEEKSMAARKKKAASGAGKMPRDLRETVKRSPGVKGWVRSLEEPVRQFLAGREAAVDTEDSEDSEQVEDESDVSDDEVVFVGRKATAPQDRLRDGWKKAHREVHDRPIDRGMIFDSLEDDESGDGSLIQSLTITDWTPVPSPWAARLDGVSTSASEKLSSEWDIHGQNFLVHYGSSFDCHCTLSMFFALYILRL